MKVTFRMWFIPVAQCVSGNKLSCLMPSPIRSPILRSIKIASLMQARNLGNLVEFLTGVGLSNKKWEVALSTFPIDEKQVERCRAAMKEGKPITITTLVYNKNKEFSGIVRSVQLEQRGSSDVDKQWLVTMPRRVRFDFRSTSLLVSQGTR